MPTDPFLDKLSPEVKRLFAIAAAIGRNPGIKPDDLVEVLERSGVPVGKSTLFREVKRLTALGLLDDRSNRDGYFLTEFTVDEDEREAMLTALRLHGQDLLDARADALFQRLVRRLTRSEEERLVMSYPVEAIGHKLIMDTTSPERAAFFDELRHVIRWGREVRLSERRNPYDTMGRVAAPRVWVLQLIFHHVGWYVLVEFVEEADRKKQPYAVFRVDRLEPGLEALSGRRGPKAQMKSLDDARAMMSRGWDMAVPARVGDEDCITAVVRFDEAAATLLSEIERGYDHFTLKRFAGGARAYVRLPDQEDVRHEFVRWLSTWGDRAIVESPPDLRALMHKRLQAACAAYNEESTSIP